MARGLARRLRLVQMNGVTRFPAAPDQNFHVRCRRFQVELQLRHPGGEIIERDQRKDGDGQSARRGNQCFANAAGDAHDGEFGAADVEKGAHETGDGAKQPEQRRKRDECVHDREETPGAFQLDARRQLQRAQQRAVRVADVVRGRDESRG